MPTQDEVLAKASRTYAAGLIAQEQMTPREQAEAAHTPTSRFTVDELEDQIRADRGLDPIHRQAPDAA
jgi:hypothetical protein